MFFIIYVKPPFENSNKYLTYNSFPVIFCTFIYTYSWDYIISINWIILLIDPRTSKSLDFYSTLFYLEFFFQVTISIVVEPSSNLLEAWLLIAFYFLNL